MSTPGPSQHMTKQFEIGMSTMAQYTNVRVFVAQPWMMSYFEEHPQLKAYVLSLFPDGIAVSHPLPDVFQGSP